MDKTSSSAEVIEQQTSSEIPAQTQKMFTQEEVNQLTGRVRQETYERAAKQTPTPQASPTTQALSQEQIQQARKAAEEVMFEQIQKSQAKQIMEKFASKIMLGKDKYPDFDEKYRSLPLSEMTPIVELLADVDNTADVLYELGKNPLKAASLNAAVQMNMPQIARQEMFKLSQSIKDNEAAQKAAQPKEPLAQIKPSNAGGDNGQMSIADFRKADWARR